MNSATLLLAVAAVISQPAVAQPPSDEPSALKAAGRPGDEISQFTVREGYAVSIAVESLPGARFMEFDDRGTLYVSRPTRGDIMAFRDDDADGVFERREIFISGRPGVHGLCFANGELWFATSGAIARAKDADGDLKPDSVVDVIPEGTLPRGGSHWYRALLVTNDTIYTAIGDSGNISDQRETDRQKIWMYALDGTNKRLLASGIRNNEKLRLRPGTNEVWGVDHGGDWFGAPLGEYEGRQAITDLNPPDEFNHYTEGGFYGHPFFCGDRTPRDEYRDMPDLLDIAAQSLPPAWKLPPHFAANAFCFLNQPAAPSGGAMPDDHRGDAFVACRGSWNSVQPVGYCIARVLFDNDTPYGQLTVVSTIKHAPRGIGPSVVFARPVDCAQAPDGSVLFSSDQPGRIYRIRHDAKK